MQIGIFLIPKKLINLWNQDNNLMRKLYIHVCSIIIIILLSICIHNVKIQFNIIHVIYEL